MKTFHFAAAGDRLSVLCLGAHSDDIEIGVGATLLSMIARGIRLEVHWCVLSGVGEREREARASAAEFLSEAASARVEVMTFQDGFFPEQGEAIKSWFETLKMRVDPDVILTHRRDDAHQDHRQLCRLTWNTFRDHCVLEYEIPKWDGDMGQPNLYVPISASVLQRKIDLLMTHFASQRSNDWFDAEVFRGLARLRGMECRAPECYAEAFFAQTHSDLIGAVPSNGWPFWDLEWENGGRCAAASQRLAQGIERLAADVAFRANFGMQGGLTLVHGLD